MIVVLTGDLRLVDVVGETNTEEGRLEIYHNSTWGTVCNDLFGTSDAIVACRQLGYRYSYYMIRQKSIKVDSLLKINL